MLKRVLESTKTVPDTLVKKKMTKGEVYQKLCNFCVYQERTQQEAREKLYDLGLPSDDVEDLLAKLITENFVNEERFAKAFAGGKFRMKKWGRNKIKQALKLKKISDYCIKKGLLEINDSDYEESVKELIVSKAKTIKDYDPFRRKHKIASYLINKGYEGDLVWEMIKKLV